MAKENDYEIFQKIAEHFLSMFGFENEKSSIVIYFFLVYFIYGLQPQYLRGVLVQVLGV
jgi:hypothetical protein